MYFRSWLQDSLLRYWLLLIDLLIDRLTDSPIYWLTDWFTDWLADRGIHPPKPIMHIAYFPPFRKIYVFPYFHQINAFWLNLRFLLPPILAMIHHALLVLDAPTGWCIDWLVEWKTDWSIPYYSFAYLMTERLVGFSNRSQYFNTAILRTIDRCGQSVDRSVVRSVGRVTEAEGVDPFDRKHE